jgi:hypothetical protein
MHWPSGTVNKAPIDGGAVTTLASGLSGPLSIALDATFVYWTNSASGMGDGSVVKLPKN